VPGPSSPFGAPLPSSPLPGGCSMPSSPSGSSASSNPRSVSACWAVWMIAFSCAREAFVFALKRAPFFWTGVPAGAAG
jgi:hypothetical protein